MIYNIAERTMIEILMMDRGILRNMLIFTPKYICEISASIWFYYKEMCVGLIPFDSPDRTEVC